MRLNTKDAIQVKSLAQRYENICESTVICNFFFCSNTSTVLILPSSSRSLCQTPNTNVPPAPHLSSWAADNLHAATEGDTLGARKSSVQIKLKLFSPNHFMTGDGRENITVTLPAITG